jgi:hypothetical protein
MLGGARWGGGTQRGTCNFTHCKPINRIKTSRRTNFCIIETIDSNIYYKIEETSP